MELDSTTFVLEIINFLVLMWLLNRFLYRPIQATLANRAAAEAARLQALATQQTALQAASEELKQQTEALQAQRSQAMDALASEMAGLKQSRLQELEHDLQDERDKAHARMEQERARLCDQSEQALRQQTSAFVAQYLQRLANPALEAVIIQLFLSDLAIQSEQARRVLRDGWASEHAEAPTIDVSTAYPPSAEQRQQVEAHISMLLGQAARIEWRTDASLLSGISVHLPGHLLEASLRRGVDAFAHTPITHPA